MKIRKLIEEDGRKLAKIFDEQILATIDTNTLDEQIRKIITRLFAYGVDWTELKDKSTDDHEVSTFAAKIKSDFANEISKELLALFTEHSKQAFKKGYLEGGMAEILSHEQARKEVEAQLKRNK